MSAARGWGWVAHLRAGGTTAWADWTGTGPDAGRFLPGAQQLELLRRLNQAGPPSAALAARVLEASAPGRGRPDLGLVGAAGPARFGPAPVDPADLPARELLRVAAGLIAEDLAAGPRPDPGAGAGSGSTTGTRLAAAARVRLPVLRRGIRQLAGDPAQVPVLRAELARRGRPEGIPGAPVLVLGADLPTLLARSWTARVLAGGAPAWPDWVHAAVRRGRLPRRADPARVAAEWADRVGAHRVTVVLDPDALPRLLGVRGPLPAPPALGADAVELARRTAPALGLLVSSAERAALLRERLVPALLAAGGTGAPPAVPARDLGWVRERAVGARDALLAGGYPVVGEPDTLLSRPRTTTEDGPAATQATATEAGVLGLAVRLLLATDVREEGR
ncbi:hypothetical protein [Nocardioides pantholopis]|uniref:hypothetical protein n=1 Tax=Nocardioides pantholopis TaxID=2483798 RepID=UPI000F09664C|nr:hypothetical protein [Nocardioides pantholopis]